MLHVHVNVYAACLRPCCIFMSMLHVQVHAAQIRTRSMDLETQHGLRHAAWTWTTQLGHEHQHVQAHAVCPYSRPGYISMSPPPGWISMFMLHINFHATYKCPCCMSQYAACTCLCCMPMSMLQVHVHATSSCPLLHVHIPAEWTEACSMDRGMQHWHGQAIRTSTCSRTWTWTWETSRSACKC